MPPKRNPPTLNSVLGGFNEDALPLAYVIREGVERAFRAGLDARTHIAVYGSPGVGKSALIRSNVTWSEVVFVECLKGQQAPDVYRSILSEAGARIKTETRLSKKRRLVATLKFFSAGAEGDFERGIESAESEVTVDLGNIGDVIRILQSRKDYRSYVVLNDFHLLARSVQRRIVNSFQYIYERTNIRFIIAGNWAAQGYLTDLNSLLPSFTASVSVPAWSREELTSVLNKVELLLNVSFSPEVVNRLIYISAGSVRELTDCCHSLLSAEGVTEASLEQRKVSNVERLTDVSSERMKRLSSRYADLLSSYLSARLYTADGADVDSFIDYTVGDLIDSSDAMGEREDEDGNDSQEKFTLGEMRRALDDAVQILNRPRLMKQLLRRMLIDALVTTVRESEEIRLPISMASISGICRRDMDLDVPSVELERALRKSARKLVQAQSKYGFNPKLLAYDPRGKTLVVVEPKFRAFLRDLNTNIDVYQNTTYRSVDFVPSWKRTSSWRGVMRRAASAHRLATAN